MSVYSGQVMHRPYVDLFVSAKASGIQGTFCRTRLYSADSNERIIGVRFRPAAFHAFYSGDMRKLSGQNKDLTVLSTLFDSAYVNHLRMLNDTEVVRKLSEALRVLQPKQSRAITLVNKIIDTIEADDTIRMVSDVAHAVGKSERWLQQLFRTYTGVRLKWFLQTKRLLTAAQYIRQNDDIDWALLAYDTGYSSQQHFITDFKRMLNKTPRQYKIEVP